MGAREEEDSETHSGKLLRSAALFFERKKGIQLTNKLGDHLKKPTLTKALNDPISQPCLGKVHHKPPADLQTADQF